jgi:FMN-dependent NADH-azoreductase
MKTLLVSYLPSGQYSKTKRLLDRFTAHSNGEVEHLNLLEQPAKPHDTQTMAAYYQRNFGGQTLAPDLEAAIAPMDALTEQFIAADIVVVAHPLHNFSIPGPVKTWVDAVMQKGKAFDYLPQQVGLMAGKKALALYTSGGVYEGNKFAYRDTVPATWSAIFSYLNFDEFEVVGANRTIVMGETAAEQSLQNAESFIERIARRWYGSETA